MRILFFRSIIVGFLLVLGSNSHAQLVITVAGIVDSTGNKNGPVYEATFNNPHGIAVDQNGNVYTADRYSHTIRKITPAGMVSTLAGINNVSGDLDGPATVATFNEPWGLCVDKSGNVIVADTRNNKIRKITPAGVVSTIAGNGNFGVADGTALFASFGNPTGIECDTLGNLYIADHLTHIIRKIDPSGNVTRLAGIPYVTGSVNGAGNQATFNRPYGLTLDNQGNIIVADEWNHKIRKITVTGMVSTVAGSGLLGHDDGTTGVAAFNYPWDVTVDAQDNIFVADGYNYIIRRISTSGNTTTYAGTPLNSGAVDGLGPAASFNGATAIAINEVSQELYVGDAYNELIRKIVPLNQGISISIANGSNVICEGSSVTLNASPQQFDNYEFFVDGSSVQSSNSPIFSSSTLLPGVHDLYVIGTTGSTTTNSGTIQITVIPTPVPMVDTLGTTTFVQGDSVVLTSALASSYLWSDGSTSQSIVVYNSGVYSVVITDSNGCSGTSTPTIVTVNPAGGNPPLIAVSVNGGSPIPGSDPVVLCPGEAAVLSSNAPTNNQWYLDGGLIQGATNQLLSVSESGVYLVEVLDGQGNPISSNVIEIEFLPAQINDFTIDNQTITAGDVVVLNADVNGLVSYEWEIDNEISTEATPSFEMNTPGVYSVLLITTDGICSDTLLKQTYLTVLAKEDTNTSFEQDVHWFIPNVFSPNNDGCNDAFYLRGDGLSDVSISIFDKWGTMIFNTDNQSTGWQGDQNGKPVVEETYVYLVSFISPSGKQVSTSGHVTVLR